jgi:DHA1 family bicyclomycin/chloramphenicol resistance-like MFS transporter
LFIGNKKYIDGKLIQRALMKIQSLHPLTIILLIAAMPLAAASLDMFLPALPAMVKEFGTDPATIQISLSLNIIGSGILGFASGILSDQFGRRKLFVSAMFAFTIATFACSLATNVVIFSILRTLQGAASGVIFVMVSAILSDVYTGVKKAQVLGISTLLFPIALGVAPFLGEWIFHHYGWAATFQCLSGVLLLTSILLFLLLPETKEQESSALSFKKIAQDAKHILCTPTFLVNSLIPAVFMGAFMGFVAYSPFIYMIFFKLTSKTYVYYFIAPMIFQFVSGLLYQAIVRIMGRNAMLTLGISGAGCALIIILGMLLEIIPLAPLYVMTSMVFYAASIPFILPTVMAKAFESFPSKAGTISSLASVIRNTLMAGYIYSVGCVFNHTPMPILGALAFGTILFICLSIYSVKLTNKQQSLQSTT